MNPTELFAQTIHRLGLPKQKLLLAVSGGVDSVALCELSRQAGLSFGIAHCNFGLRGDESDRDEKFVKSLGEKYGVAVFIKRFATAAYAQEQKLSVQEAARNLRYDWFEQLRKEQGFDFVLLAHHADDNVETLLLNFFRGTGLEGLTGMPEEKQGTRCLRPMLALRRREIEAFAKERGLTWVEDSSNASSKYTRNFLRNEIIPQLRNTFPQVEETLLRNAGRMKQTAALYKPLVADLKKKICEVRGQEVHIPVLKLLQYKHTSLVYEIIKDFGFGETAVAEVLKLTEAESGRYVANESFRIIRHRRWLVVAPFRTTAGIHVINREDSLLHFDKHRLKLKFTAREKTTLDPSPQVAQLNAKEIRFPLVLRKWKAGDYFYPLGMQKKKKLARFFIDQKLSKTEKENLWVLESHKRIVWVVGMRIDDRFKLTDQTKDVLVLELV